MTVGIELRELVEEVCNGTATAAHFGRLNQLLVDDEEAALFYATYLRMHGVLLWRYRDEIICPMSEALPPRPPAEVADPCPRYLPLPASFRSEPEEPSWFPPPPVVYVVSAIIALVCVAALFHWNRSPVVPQQVAEQPAAPPQIALPRLVGRILDTVNCQWAAGAAVVGNDADVRIGQVFRLESGLLRIGYETGAIVVLQGPVSYEASSSNGGTLFAGKLTGKVAVESAKGFAVRTPTATVVDLGTEFGIEVGENQQTTSHVFQGAVKLLTMAEGGRSTSLVVRENEAARIERSSDQKGSLVIVPCGAAKPDAFVRDGQLRSFLRWETHSRELRQDPTLLAYYDFQKQDASPTVLPNVAGSRDASLDGAIDGARWTSGRMVGKDALQFNGMAGGVRVNLPKEANNLTLSAWVCVESLGHEQSSLLMSEDDEADHLHWQLTIDGCICCDLLAVSSVPPTHNLSSPVFDRGRLGRWTHLAVVYDQARGEMGFFCDGAIVNVVKVTAEGNRAVSVGPGSIGYWRHDKSHRDAGPRSLRGRMDELAIFGRALTAEEIRQMVEAGKPDPELDGTASQDGEPFVRP